MKHLPRPRWRKWCMTDQSICSRLCASRASALLVLTLLSGCGTPSQPVPPAQPEAPKTVANQPATAAKAIDVSIHEENNIFFSLGSGTVNHSEMNKLRIAAKRLKEDKRLCVTLLGHANDNGSTSLNLAVADSRVQSVAKGLKKLGVGLKQIKIQVIGGEGSSNTCRSQECRSRMRRVELIFSTTE